ncbi:uncharacterized protein [Typha latifolia]|uniref:uncharacterized protein n=1 Tax=Typha latifolia TaxID=4733 RepID=UPI003C2CDA61
MDAFFNGLDCRLRVSGKVADSIMMGIVNSAMEAAYKKSLSKEGDLERLNEKSRFCELAIMQLEWCLKFLQEEMDNNLVESTHDREQLLADLLETRDRIHRRLEETEIAIAEKDRELTRSRKSESKLRVALEVKGEEMSSLLTALGSERVKGERASEPVQCSKIGGHMFNEWKCLVDNQIYKISGKLENGRQILTTVMQKLGGSSSNIERVDHWIDDTDGMKTVNDLYNMAQLLMEFEEVIMDAGILKESIDSSFEMMINSIELFKTALDEHQWVSNTEKEMSIIILKNILTEVKCNCNVKSGSPFVSLPIQSDMDWSALMDAIKTLQDDLELLTSHIYMQPELDDDMELNIHHNLSSRAQLGGRSKCDTGTLEGKLHRSGETLRCDNDASGAVDSQEFSTTSHFKSSGNIGGISKETPSGHLVTDLTRNQSIIQTKTQEINGLKRVLSREKGDSSLRYNKNFDAVKEAVTVAIRRLDTIKGQKVKLVVASPGDNLLGYERNMNNFHHKPTGFGSVEKESNSQSLRESPEHSNNRSCCYLTGAEPCEEIRKLIEYKSELEFQSGLLEDTYKILFKGLIRRESIESFDFYIKTLIMEDTFRVVICTIINEWSGIRETSDIERLLKDEIDCIVFGGITKDIIGMHYMTTIKCQDKHVPFNNNFVQRFEIMEPIEQEHEVNSLSNDFVSGEGLDFNCDSGLMKPQFYTSFDEFKSGESNECNIQTVEMLVEKDDAFNSVSEKFGKALQQIVNSKMQLKELASSLGVAVDNMNVTCDQVTSVIDVAHDGKLSPPLTMGSPHWNWNEQKYLAHDEKPSLPSTIGFQDRNWNEQQHVLMPFTQFSQALMSFEFMSCERIRTNISRLDDLKQQLGPLVEQVNLIKRKEVLYSKAFMRRCYDLQTAEAEVDLLGDQVDILLGLIKKTYVALDHYSPVLQRYFGMMEILDSLKKELDVEHRK